MANNFEAQFPSLDPTTGKLRPEHVPEQAGESVEALKNEIELIDGVFWAGDGPPTSSWIAAVRAAGKTPLDLKQVRKGERLMPRLTSDYRLVIRVTSFNPLTGAPTDQDVVLGNVRGEKGLDGSNVLPTNEAIIAQLAAGPARIKLENDFVLQSDYSKTPDFVQEELEAAATLYTNFERNEVIDRGYDQGKAAFTGNGRISMGHTNRLPVPFVGGNVGTNTLPTGWEWHQTTPTKVLQSLTSDGISWRGTSVGTSGSSLGGIRTSTAIVAPGESVILSFDAELLDPTANIEMPTSIMTMLLRTTDSVQTAGTRSFTLGEDPQRVVTKLTAPSTGTENFKVVIVLIGGSPSGGVVGSSVTASIKDLKLHNNPAFYPAVGERWAASHVSDTSVTNSIVNVTIPAGTYYAVVKTRDFGWTVKEYVHPVRNFVNPQHFLGPNANLDIIEFALVPKDKWKSDWLGVLTKSPWVTAKAISLTTTTGYTASSNVLAKALGTFTNESVSSSLYDPTPHHVAPNTRYATTVDTLRPGRFRFEVNPGERAPTDVAAGRMAYRSEIGVTSPLPYDTDEWFSCSVQPVTAIPSVTPFYGATLIQYRYKNNSTGDNSSLSPEIQFEMMAGSQLRLRVRTDNGTPVLTGDAMPPGTTTVNYGPWDYTPGQWFNIVMRLRFSKSGGGYLGFWLNGATIFDGPHAVGYNRDRGPTLRFGTYSYATSRVVAEFRNLERSDTTLAARITNPLPL